MQYGGSVQKRVAIVAAFAVLSGCGGKATGLVDLAGSFSLTYSGGGLSGSWSANAAMPSSSGDQATIAWAASDLGTGTVFTTSMQPRTATTHDLAILTTRRRTVGTETLSAGCSSNCSRLYVMFGSPNPGSSEMFLQECTMTVGTITISAISSNRVTGTFSGTGTCTNFFGGGSTAFTVTNGSFDTAILPNV